MARKIIITIKGTYLINEFIQVICKINMLSQLCFNWFSTWFVMVIIRFLFCTLQSVFKNRGMKPGSYTSTSLLSIPQCFVTLSPFISQHLSLLLWITIVKEFCSPYLLSFLLALRMRHEQNLGCTSPNDVWVGSRQNKLKSCVPPLLYEYSRIKGRGLIFRLPFIC